MSKIVTIFFILLFSSIVSAQNKKPVQQDELYIYIKKLESDRSLSREKLSKDAIDKKQLLLEIDKQRNEIEDIKRNSHTDTMIIQQKEETLKSNQKLFARYAEREIELLLEIAKIEQDRDAAYKKANAFEIKTQELDSLLKDRDIQSKLDRHKIDSLTGKVEQIKQDADQMAKMGSHFTIFQPCVIIGNTSTYTEVTNLKNGSLIINPNAFGTTLNGIKYEAVWLKDNNLQQSCASTIKGKVLIYVADKLHSTIEAEMKLMPSILNGFCFYQMNSGIIGEKLIKSLPESKTIRAAFIEEKTFISNKSALENFWYCSEKGYFIITTIKYIPIRA